MSNYDLILLDLDGTLLDKHSEVSEKNRNALYRAQQSGIQIALCTGRNLAETRMFNDMLKQPADWMILSSGAHICRADGSDEVLHDKMDLEICNCILDICEQEQGEPCFYTATDLYYGKSFERVLARLRENGHHLRLGAPETQHLIEQQGMEAWRTVLAELEQPIYKSVVYGKTEQATARLCMALEQSNLYEVVPTEMFGGLLHSIEINRRGIHKGAALRALAEHLGIPISRTMAIGDSANDLTMLKVAGCGVAMGNAAKEVKKAADLVTTDNTGSGVACAIEQYAL